MVDGGNPATPGSTKDALLSGWEDTERQPCGYNHSVFLVRVSLLHRIRYLFPGRDEVHSDLPPFTVGY